MKRFLYVFIFFYLILMQGPVCTSSVQDNSEILLWIDSKPALTAKEFEEKTNQEEEMKLRNDLRKALPAQFKKSESEDYYEVKKRYFDALLLQKIIDAWAAKENIFSLPEVKEALSQRVRSLENMISERYFIRFKKMSQQNSEMIEEQIKKQYGIETHLEFIESPIEDKALIVANGNPVLTVKEFNQQLGDIWDVVPFKLKEKPPFTLEDKRVILKGLAFEKAINLWIQENKIDQLPEYQKELNSVQDQVKQNLMTRYFEKHFKIDTVVDSPLRTTTIAQLKKDLNVKENLAYFEKSSR